MSIDLRSNGDPLNREEYEWKSASVNVAGTDATTDLSTLTGFTTLFTDVKTAYYIKIESSATAYIRLNKNDNDKITVTATTPFESEVLSTEKIFVSTGGSAVTVTVTLA